MTSIRKSIGYLPSLKIQKIISKLANKEKLSQSKVLGILVKGALIAREIFDLQKTNDLIRKSKYRKESNMFKSSLNYSDLDE